MKGLNMKTLVLLAFMVLVAVNSNIRSAFASGSESAGGSNAAADEKKDDDRNEKREEMRKKMRDKRKKPVKDAQDNSKTQTPSEQKPPETEKK
jgi:hypothetical protein